MPQNPKPRANRHGSQSRKPQALYKDPVFIRLDAEETPPPSDDNPWPKILFVSVLVSVLVWYFAPERFREAFKHIFHPGW